MGADHGGILEVCRQSGANAVLDLKFTSVEDIISLVQKIQELGMEDSVVCLSGSLDQLKKIRECSEIIRIKYLVEEGTQETIDQWQNCPTVGLQHPESAAIW